jgi:hypothetical protein
MGSLAFERAAKPLMEAMVPEEDKCFSWEQIHQCLGRVAEVMGEWAGVPMPVKGQSMVVHPSYPFAEQLSKVFCPDPEPEEEESDSSDEEWICRNSWRSMRHGREVQIWQNGQTYRVAYGRRVNTAPLILETLHAALAWDYAAEVRAVEKLSRHISQTAFEHYVMTGSFLESSEKSGLFYVFRRLRPTIALTAKKGDCMHIIAALCAHPIGYYTGSWAGALVPTDDVISHLLLMRSDEHYFWRISNQHPAWAPEAGL